MHHTQGTNSEKSEYLQQKKTLYDCCLLALLVSLGIVSLIAALEAGNSSCEGRVIPQWVNGTVLHLNPVSRVAVAYCCLSVQMPLIFCSRRSVHCKVEIRDTCPLSVDENKHFRKSNMLHLMYDSTQVPRSYESPSCACSLVMLQALPRLPCLVSHHQYEEADVEVLLTR